MEIRERALLGKDVFKASIAKILTVSRSALYHFIETRKIAPGGIVKLTGFRGNKPPYRVFRRGFITDILGLFQLVMRELDNALVGCCGGTFERCSCRWLCSGASRTAGTPAAT